jgi:hypothetical protein
MGEPDAYGTTATFGVSVKNESVADSLSLNESHLQFLVKV